MSKPKPKGRLATMLVAVGAIGALWVFMPRPDVTVEDLRDAGLNECRSQAMECPVVRIEADGGTKRARMLLEGHLCDAEDGGQFLVHVRYWDWDVADWNACKLTGADGGWPKVLP